MHNSFFIGFLLIVILGRSGLMPVVPVWFVSAKHYNRSSFGLDPVLAR